MKKSISIITSILFFFSIFFNFGIVSNTRAETQSSDVPVVNSISLSSDTLKKGEGLVIQLNITDNTSGSGEFCYGYFYNGQNPAYVKFIKVSDHQWVGTLITQNSMEEGTWVLTELNIIDGASKTHKITSFPGGSYQVVLKGQLDQIPKSSDAIIENIEISPQTAQSGGDIYFTAKITNATTNGGGLIIFQNQAGIQVEEDLVPLGNNVWAGSLKVNERIDKGKWIVSSFLFGYPGEQMGSLAIPNKEQLCFDVNKAENNWLVLESLSFKERILTPGDKIEIQAKVKDNASNIKSFYAYFSNGTNGFIVMFTLQNDQSWIGTAQLDEKLPGGVYKLTFCPDGAIDDGRLDESKVKDTPVLVLTGDETSSDNVLDPQVDLLDQGSNKATGKADSGIYILVMTEDGEIIGIGQADSTGKFDVGFQPVNGKTLCVVAMNNNGDSSNPKIIPTLTFKDINHVTWAKEAIENIATLGIISGMGDGNFAPDNQVTRAQFAKLVVRTLGLEGETAPLTFKDVNTSDWFYNDIALAVKYGIVYGKSKTEFGPNDPITRQDMAVMMYRAVKLIDPSVTPMDMNGSLRIFNDQSSIASYAREGAAVMVENNIIYGMGDNQFSPTTFATRAQAAVILYRFMNSFE